MRVFALSVGATALCMLASWSYLEPQPQEALEASVFNGSQGYQATTSAAPSGEAPGQVVPLGSAFGIKLFTDGVIVASLSDLYTANGGVLPRGGGRPAARGLPAGGGRDADPEQRRPGQLHRPEPGPAHHLFRAPGRQRF